MAETVRDDDLTLIHDESAYQEKVVRDKAYFDQQQKETQNEARLVDIRSKLLHGQGYYAAAEAYADNQPVYYDKNNIWWIYNQTTHSWEYTDETHLLITLKRILKTLGDSTIKRKHDLIEGLRQVGRTREPREIPKEKIQFGIHLFDVNTQEVTMATHEDFSINPIPWVLGETSETPVIDKLFTEWVGEEWKQTLYEIIAYTCYRSYPIHLIFVLDGAGANGKSQFLELIHRFLGSHNIASTSFERIQENRFETFSLYKKLASIVGETNFGILKNTDMLKRLSGGDAVPYEQKGGKTFTDRNYTKLLISTNSLPSSLDTSDGFYRRWFIIKFPNQFEEGKDVVDSIPESEYGALARKVTMILPGLLERHEFANQGTREERKERYIDASNPLTRFLRDFCDLTNLNAHTKYGTLYTRYAHWLTQQKRRKVGYREFNDFLQGEGIEVDKTWKIDTNGENVNTRWVLGIRLLDDNEIRDRCDTSSDTPLCDTCDRCDLVSTPPITRIRLSGNPVTSVTAVTNREILTVQDVQKIIFLDGEISEDVLVGMVKGAKNPREFISIAVAVLAQKGQIYSPEPRVWRANQ